MLAFPDTGGPRGKKTIRSKVQGRHPISAVGKDGGSRGTSGYGNLRIEPGSGGGQTAPTGGRLDGRGGDTRVCSGN